MKKPGFWQRLWKRRPAAAPDPLRGFDEALGLVTRRGEEVRRSAATLLALRTELAREAQRWEVQLRQLDARANETPARQDASVRETLARDEVDTRRRLRAVEEGLARVEVDAQLLTDAATELREQEASLRAERTEIATRLRAGQAVVATAELSARLEWAQSLRLEEARDEVERAHALADLYREGRRHRGE